jgi:uncharacterized RDD family membrane protein YckC
VTRPARAEVIATASLPPPAGLARRLASAVYEVLLLAALLFFVNFLLLPLVSPGQAQTARALTMPDLPLRVVLFCAVFAAAALYFVGCWTGGRRTLPMKTWRIHLVDATGGALDYKTALVRYLAAWIGPGLALATYAFAKPFGLGGIALVPLALNYLAAFVDPERQFLHDRIAGTRIVEDPVTGGGRISRR